MNRGILERFALRDWRAVTGLFFFSTMLESFAMGHLAAFTPLLLERELGVPAAEVGPWTGLLTAATFAVAFPLAPFWGALAQRYSHKLIIVRSIYIEALAYTLCAFAPNLAWFAAARLLLGLTFGNIAVIIAAQSLLAPERRLATAISIVQATNPVAMSVGPLLGAWLLPTIGLRGLFLLDGAILLVAAVMVTMLMPEPPGRDTRRSVMGNLRGAAGAVWRQPSVRWNFAAWFLARGAMSTVDSYLPVRIAELVRPDPAAAIGWVLGGFGLLTTIATSTIGRVIDRFGPTRLLWPSAALACVSSVGIALAPELWLLTLFAWARAIPVGLTGTALYSHMALVLRRADRAPVMAFTPAPRNVAAFTLPLLAAGLATVSTAAALMVAAGAYGVATWVSYRMAQLTPGELAARAKEREASPLETPP